MEKFYKVNNGFGRISKVFNNYEDAKALFNERMALNDEYVELSEIIHEIGKGYHGHGVEYFNKDKYYTA